MDLIPILFYNPFLGCMCVGITMLLTLSVFQVVVSNKLPTTSDAIPVIGKSDSSCNY